MIEVEKVLELIKKYNKIIIFGHVRPDGDCIGSQYGLYNIIKSSFKEKEVYISGDVSEYVSFIGRPQIQNISYKDALGICVDTANSDRVSDQRYTECDYLIKIDHHPNVDDFCNYSVVNTKAPACAEILTDFYLKFDELKLNKEGALALYVGILTDTGRFKFDSVTSNTFYVASKLLEFGLDLGYIDNNLSIESIESLKLRGYCLENFKTTENGFAYIVMKRETIEKYNVSDEDAANQVTSISTIKGYPVWAMFIEYPQEIRIRLRSRGPVINLLAEKYNGGGHAKASGARLDSWSDLDKFLNDVDLLVKEYKEKNE